MTTTRRCPSCGSELAADAAYGVCPRCLLQPNLFGADSLGPSPGEAQTAAPSAMAGRGARVLPPPSPDELAEHFPQLEILELIGQGGMGAVYKARQRGLDRFVALKILAPAANDDAQFAERFSREARALARLNHPHIVGVFDSGRAGPYFYLTLEYVDGVNLRQAMRAGTIQPGQALEMVTQICEALQYAHNEHVVHRDIKPENVMVDQHGQVKVADFGLAKLVDPDTPDHGLTATHQVMGTPRYMAPEQLEGARDVDHRADIYSLGVIFYELLTGELPLGRFPPPSRRVRVDVRLDEVVLRTLEKQPELRYQQAEDLRTDVDGIRSTPSAKARQQNGYEYRSAAAIFGLPLLHVAMGVDAATGKRRVAKGVIAIGDVAIGGIAIGGMAMGGVAIGGVTCGVLALGGLALGLLVFGGLAAGFVAMGGAAAGYLAVGGVAFGPRAYGGLTLPPRAVAAQVQYAPLHFTPPLATDMRTMSPEAPSVPPEAPSAPP